MTYSHEVEHMCVVKKGPNHGPAPIPEEATSLTVIFQLFLLANVQRRL